MPGIGGQDMQHMLDLLWACRSYSFWVSPSGQAAWTRTSKDIPSSINGLPLDQAHLADSRGFSWWPTPFFVATKIWCVICWRVHGAHMSKHQWSMMGELCAEKEPTRSSRSSTEGQQKNLRRFLIIAYSDVMWWILLAVEDPIFSTSLIEDYHWHVSGKNLASCQPAEGSRRNFWRKGGCFSVKGVKQLEVVVSWLDQRSATR